MEVEMGSQLGGGRTGHQSGKKKDVGPGDCSPSQSLWLPVLTLISHFSPCPPVATGKLRT